MWFLDFLVDDLSDGQFFWLIFLFVQWGIGVSWMVRVGRDQIAHEQSDSRNLWRAVALFATLQLLCVATVLSLQLGGLGDWTSPIMFIVGIIGLLWIQCLNARPMHALRAPDLAPKGYPLLDDDSARAAVAEISNDLGIRPPHVRVCPVDQPLMGWMWGLCAPCVLITRGVQERLPARERDALIAHELAHIANASVWWGSAAAPLALAVTLLLTPAINDLSLALWGLLLWLGTTRILSRYFEFDCDRRAAMCVGTPIYSTMLKKVHTSSSVEETGFRSTLAYMLATHPSLHERLAALERGIPEEDDPGRIWNEADVRRRGKLFHVSVVLWALLLIVAAWPRWSTEWFLLRTALLSTALALPALAMIGGLRPDARASAKRQRYRSLSPLPRRLLIVGTGLVATMFLLVNAGLIDLLPRNLGLGLMIGSAAIWLAGLFSMFDELTTRRRLIQQLASLLALKKWEAIIQLAAKRQTRFRTSPEALTAVAQAHFAQGRTGEALQQLHQVTARMPGYAIAWYCVIYCRLQQAEFAAATASAQETVKHFPRAHFAYLSLARCARLQGDTAAARDALHRGEELLPGTSSGLAERAAQSLSAGDWQAARVSIEEAENKDPGDQYLSLLRCWADVLAGNLESANQRLAFLEGYVRENPLDYMEPEFNIVRSLLAERTRDSAHNPGLAEAR